MSNAETLLGPNEESLTFESVRSLCAFLQTIDRQSSAGFLRVPALFESSSDNSYSIGYCDKTLFDLGRATTMIHAAERWINDQKLRAEAMRGQAQNQLVPISKLPNEVLREIFILSRDQKYRMWSEPILTVCARWRRCAISTPALWSSFTIHDGTHPAELSLCLTRSRSCPLFITISLPCAPNKPLSFASSGRFDLFESIISQATDRITSLTMCNVPISGQQMPLSILQAGSIEELTCTFVRGFVTEREKSGQPYPPLPEANFSSLRRLTLEGGMPGGFTLGSTAFASLSSLTLTASAYPKGTWLVLGGCLSLETLEWRTFSPDVNGENIHDHLPAAYELEPLKLPRLKKVKLHHTASPLFFRAVVSHNVQEAVLHAPPRYFLDDLPAYLDDEDRGRIRKLEFQDTFKLSAADISVTLSLFPSLEVFASNSWRGSSLRAAHVLSQFDPGEDYQWRWKCPHLKHLELGFEHTMTQEKAKNNGASLSTFEKKLRDELLFVLKALTAERARDATNPLRIHVKGLYLELPKIDGDEDHWSSVVVDEAEEHSLGADQTKRRRLKRFSSDSSDDD